MQLGAAEMRLFCDYDKSDKKSTAQLFPLSRLVGTLLNCNSRCFQYVTLLPSLNLHHVIELKHF